MRAATGARHDHDGPAGPGGHPADVFSDNDAGMYSLIPHQRKTGRAAERGGPVVPGDKPDHRFAASRLGAGTATRTSYVRGQSRILS